MCLIRIKHTEKKESIIANNTEILRIHLRCPYFEGENDSGTACEKLNAFYKDTAKEFTEFCKKRYAPMLERKVGRNECGGASMNWFLTFENGFYISIITDISVFDGEKTHIRRYCHTFDLDGCAPVSAKRAFDTTNAAKHKYISMICDKIRKKEGNMPFDKNAEKNAARYFDFEKYYLTPNGIAFYYKNGILFPSESRFPSFVIPYSQTEGLRINVRGDEKGLRPS